MSSSRENRAVLEKEAGLFLRTRCQRAKGRRSGRCSRIAGFSGSGQPGVRTVSVENRSGEDVEEVRRVTTKDPKKMIRKREPKKGFLWRTSWHGSSGDKQEES